MDLLALPQLQPMLKVSQERVRRSELVIIVPADVALVMKFLQREQRSARTQPRFSAAVHSLQTLNQKFDIADPPAIDFYVQG